MRPTQHPATAAFSHRRYALFMRALMSHVIRDHVLLGALVAALLAPRQSVAWALSTRGPTWPSTPMTRMAECSERVAMNRAVRQGSSR